MKKFITAASLVALMAVPAMAQDTTVPKPAPMPAATAEPAAVTAGTDFGQRIF